MPTSSIQKVVPRPGYCGLQLVITQRAVKELENMSDGEENADTRHSCEDEQKTRKGNTQTQVLSERAN